MKNNDFIEKLRQICNVARLCPLGQGEAIIQKHSLVLPMFCNKALENIEEQGQKDVTEFLTFVANIENKTEEYKNSI